MLFLMLGWNSPYRCNPNIWIDIALEDIFHQQADGNISDVKGGEGLCRKRWALTHIFRARQGGVCTSPAKGALSKALRRFRVSVEAVPEKGSHVGMRLWKLVKTQLWILTAFDKTVNCWVQASSCTCSNRALHCSTTSWRCPWQHLHLRPSN